MKAHEIIVVALILRGGVGGGGGITGGRSTLSFHHCSSISSLHPQQLLKEPEEKIC